MLRLTSVIPSSAGSRPMGPRAYRASSGSAYSSFWTVGDELRITSTGDDRRAYQMVMRKGDPTYVVTPMRALFGDGGTEVRIAPLLDGIRGLSGEKIQWYLAAELRDPYPADRRPYQRRRPARA